MKELIALYGASNHGKSQTIKMVFEDLKLSVGFEFLTDY